MSVELPHVLIAAALLAAPASLGVATQTDLIETPGSDAGHGSAPLASQQFSESETVDTFEGEVGEEIDEATLDLRIDRGAVKVVAWEKDTYRIEVLQEAGSDSTVGDSETTTEFDETVEDGTLSLNLVVDREGQGAHVQVATEEVGSGELDRAIVAKVPARLSYTELKACEGQTYDAPDDQVPGVHLGGNSTCVESAQPVQGSPSISVATQNGTSSGLNVTSGLVGLEGQTARFDSDVHDVVLEDLAFADVAVAVDSGDVTAHAIDVDSLHLEADSGDVTADEVEATDAHLGTDSGDVTLEGAIEELHADADSGDVTVTGRQISEAHVGTDSGDIALDGGFEDLQAEADSGDVALATDRLVEGSIVTDSGDIDAMIQPASSGDLGLEADSGDVEVTLAHAENIGYKAHGASDSGDVTIELVDEAGGDEGVPADEDDPGSGDEESAKTRGYEDKPIRLAIDAQTDNGEVSIVENQAGSQDGGDDGSSGSQTGLLS